MVEILVKYMPARAPALLIVAAFLAVTPATSFAQDAEPDAGHTTQPEPLPPIDTNAANDGETASPPDFFADTSSQSAAPAEVRFDSAEVTPMTVPAQALQEFRDDSDFDYSSTNPGHPDTAIERFKRWLQELLLDLFGATSDSFNTLLWIALAFVSLFAIISITGVRRMFGSSGKSLVSGIEELGEDIHGMDFNRLIDQAAAAGDYRRAIRLHYLKNLKQLTDSSLIDWRIDKTNDQYLTELRGTPVAEPFRQATVAFEYAWYGDVKLTKPLFERLCQRFNIVGEIAGESAPSRGKG